MIKDEPTYAQRVAILAAVMLDKPVPFSFPEVEAEIRREVAALEAQGLVPDIPEV